MAKHDSNIESIYPLSPMQQDMLFHTLLEPNSGVSFNQKTCVLTGSLQQEAWICAWQRVVERHQPLRTLFVWEGQSKPLQVVRRQVTLPCQELDWSGLSAKEQTARLEEFLRIDRKRGFDLGQAPLMRLTLIRLSECSYQFIWSYHHILMDGWSSYLVLKEVLAVYEAISQGRDCELEPPRPYQAYINWLQGQDFSKAEGFWRVALKGFGVPTPLWVSRADEGRADQDHEVAEQLSKPSSPLVTALGAVGRQHGLTLGTIVHGAWALLLSRYHGEDDVIFGSTVSCRPPELSGIDSTVGLFINTLLIRACVSPQESVLTWLKKFQTQLVELQEYAHTPLVDVKGWSEVRGDRSLFESVVDVTNFPVDASLWDQQHSLKISDRQAFERTSYPLFIFVIPREELTIRIQYDARLFDAAAIIRMLGHFNTLLEGIVSNPEQRLSDLSLLTRAERQQLIVDWNRADVEYPSYRCLHELIADQVDRTPDAVAVVFEDKCLTYRQLDERANQLARYLQKLGVGPETLVGICVERSLELVVGLLGILKAGGAFVPLDPDYPGDRLAFMLQDAAVRVLLTQAHLTASLPAHQSRIVQLDSDWPSIAEESRDGLRNAVTAEQLAYMIYTSGSTGTPKGVMIEHGGLVQHCVDCRGVYGLTSRDRVLQFASLSFDTAIEEILPSLVSGASVVLREPAVWLPSEFRQKLAELGLTVIQLTPAYWHQLAETWANAIEPISAHQLRLVIIGGDIMSAKTLQLWRQTPFNNVRLLNTYGPTETIITATSFEIPMADRRQAMLERIPIGRPLGNRQIYVLDHWCRPAPVGVPGELHIGGTALARGYHNRPELTAEKFIADPFSRRAGARLYRTGDLVRYLTDGNIEFLGRVDQQVKIRGFRIELGEIESILGRYASVREALVVAVEDEKQDKRLVAYLVAKEPAPPSVSELRAFLKKKLPEYMVPSTFVILERFPLTSNGKVDREALPAPEVNQIEIESYAAPTTDSELAMCRIWCEMLNLRHVGVRDNFFDLGGHSLAAIRVIGRINQMLNVELSMRDVFNNPTIEALAAMVDQEKSMEALLRREIEDLTDAEVEAEFSARAGSF
jgi:surfactin family lipopeptide synthetase C